MGIVAAFIYNGQLAEMRYTNKLTQKALQTGDKNLEQTLAKMQSQTDAITRMAVATEKGNQNTVAADRPMVAGIITVTDFEVGKVPLYHIALLNTGKRTAFIERSEVVASIFKSVPSTPPKRDTVGVPSTGMLETGGRDTLDYPMSKAPLSAVAMNDFRTGYWIPAAFATVTYRDPQDGSRHYTHRCIYFIPGKDFQVEGFYNCRYYNDSN